MLLNVSISSPSSEGGGVGELANQPLTWSFQLVRINPSGGVQEEIKDLKENTEKLSN